MEKQPSQSDLIVSGDVICDKRWSKKWKRLLYDYFILSIHLIIVSINPLFVLFLKCQKNGQSCNFLEA